MTRRRIHSLQKKRKENYPIVSHAYIFDVKSWRGRGGVGDQNSVRKSDAKPGALNLYTKDLTFSGKVMRNLVRVLVQAFNF